MKTKKDNNVIPNKLIIATISEKRQKALSDSSSFYLTLVTISISLALGLFCTEIKVDYLLGAEADFIYWLKCLSILQVLVLVWYEYMLGTILFKWILNHLDVIFLFTITVIIFLLVKTTNDTNLENYFLMYAMFFLMAILGHLNQYIRSQKIIENKGIFTLLGKTHYLVIAYELLALLFYAASYYALANSHDNTDHGEGLLIFSNIILLGFMLGSYFLVWRRVFLPQKNT